MKIKMHGCIFVVLALLVIPSTFAADVPASDVTPLERAQYHAPILYQNVGSTPRADIVTRFDYDGDLDTENNWDNLEKFHEPANVYYSVTETQTHAFIMYGFFHVRDYKSFFGHENDMEGALIVVRKDETPYGTVELVQTLAHNVIPTSMHPVMISPPGMDHPRPALWIEAKGHGVHFWKSEKEFKKDTASGDKGRFIFYPGLTASDPTDSKEGTYSYALLSTVTELWNRRDQMGKDKTFKSPFDYEGLGTLLKGIPSAFRGRGHIFGTARPPWAWSDMSLAHKKGDWFFNPILYVKSHLSSHETFSMVYTSHLLLNLDVPNTLARAQGAPSRLPAQQ